MPDAHITTQAAPEGLAPEHAPSPDAPDDTHARADDDTLPHEHVHFAESARVVPDPPSTGSGDSEGVPLVRT
ncbi:uncharacterized protein B0H18DRAFT_1079758 [Fomitopsis serialis]|uniref:uncharacterized protein n=1 Tax=Fomitopsis serialis TaxID=139415 RepID=UPI0020073E74|nr:uncharacterized protein B0H18DRAFT_1079758 [Neoantrodia serialis]KAH9906105.1 hypothetical protein B0H18DRAFT_1079758 [Neoantrodia serialis]